jgi:hypothetical protein
MMRLTTRNNYLMHSGDRRGLVVAAAAAGLALAACAGAPRVNTAGNDGPPATVQKTRCVTHDTASRIPQTDPQCQASGRSYSGEDISRTGAQTAGQALQLLDPSVTISH